MTDILDPPPPPGPAPRTDGDAPAASFAADGIATPDQPVEEPVSRLRSLTSLAAILALIALISVKFGMWALVIVGGLIISIVLHEFGHYLAAKQAGMKVTEFFVGFGPKLFSFRRGETEYGIKPIPLGAYVRIVGHEQPRGGRAGRRGPHLPREGLLGPAAGSCWPVRS